jgi:hypothetical protein
MKVGELFPTPNNYEPFRRSCQRFIPARPGCYAITVLSKEILYLGLTKNLRARMGNHLDNPEKTKATKNGRAAVFFWLETTDTRRVERTWMNIHIQREGALPILNRIYSPTSS